MNIRNVVAAGITAAALGLASFGAVIPAQAANEGSCLIKIQPYSLTDSSSGDADDMTAAMRACETAATPASPTYSTGSVPAKAVANAPDALTSSAS